MPSKKILIRDSRSCVSKTGANLHKIVGIMVDDTSKQGIMHEHVGKHAKMQIKPNGWHKASNASITSSHIVEKGPD